MSTLLNVKKIRHATRLVTAAFRKYRGKLAIMVMLGVVGGLFESFGIGAAIPLFYLMNGQTAPENDYISRTVDRVFSVLHIPLNPPLLLGFIVCLFIIKGFVQFVARYTNARIVGRYEEEMRKELFERTLRANWSYLLNQRLGHLESILLYDVERAASILNLMTGIILLATSFAMYAVIALSISAKITLLTIFLGGLIFFLLKPVFYWARQLFREAAAIQKEVTHQVSENLVGAKVVKTTATESMIIQKLNDYFKRLRLAKVRTAFYRQATNTFIEPLGFVVIAALFVFSYRSPAFNIAAFAVTMYLIQRMFSYLQSMQGQLQSVNESVPYLSAMVEYRQTAAQNRENDSGTETFRFERVLDFHNIRFGYGPTGKVLNGMTFSVPKGQMVGLIGPSGAGKTTVVDLILRLFNPQGGEILADGKNISNVRLADWRKHIGYVAQDIFLLNDTIENNIRFYDASISEENIVRAAKAANIYDVIQGLPDTFRTMVGERGVKLSGGQRQRIALARALARNPDILVLDEATSALDNESEAMIQESINSLRGRVTIIAIAHRLSTTMNADKLVVLENGVVVEEGAPGDLMNNPDSYLHRAQGGPAVTRKQ